MNGGLLTGVTVSPVENGAALVLEGRFESADAELRQGGVWIALNGAINDAAGRVVVDAEAYPDAAPQHSTGTPSGPSAMADASAGGTGQPDSDRASAPTADAGPGAPTALEPGSAMPAYPASAAPATPVSDPDMPEAGIAASEAASAPCDGTAARVQESPWDLDVLAAHADCLVTLGQRDNAAGLYERVLAFEPTHFRANIGLARIREAQGRGQEAAALYERAASAAMTDGEALAAQNAANRNRGGDR